jgi:hypothetical protein
MWQKYGMIKPGMTHAEVYAILPPTGAFPGAGGMIESWNCGRIHGEGCTMTVVYGADGRVSKVDRRHRHAESNLSTDRVK